VFDSSRPKHVEFGKYHFLDRKEQFLPGASLKKMEWKKEGGVNW